MTISIGTASWADKSLIDTARFYPPEASTPEARLRYYATQFPLVEVDTSFYALPSAPVVRQWALRTPMGFTMNAKAFRLFTGHQTSPAVLPPDVREALPMELKDRSVIYYKQVPIELADELWDRFIDGVAPLRSAGKLGLVHFQFAPWLVRNRAGHAHVAHCVERMAGHTTSLEFRSASWFDGIHVRDTMAFQRELGAVHTIVDEPQGFSNTVPAIWEVTHDRCALVRMHGRNAAAWNDRSGHSGGRFNYDYDDAELEGLAHHMMQIDRPDLDLQVVMNNNNEDKAQRNGRTLFNTLGDLNADVRAPLDAGCEFELQP
jgi:uncharacterized protein YecE (DUF72 family)